MVNINNKIKYYRNLKKISQAELAEATGLAQQTVSRVEKLGTTNLITARKIANYFGVGIDDIFLNKNTIKNVKKNKKKINKEHLKCFFGGVYRWRKD